MTNIKTKLKFCVDCKWSRRGVVTPLRCVQPQVNADNASYLATGRVGQAQQAALARIYNECSKEGNLFEPKETPNV